MDAKYLLISQAMRYFLPLLSLIKKIGFILELQRDTSKVLCGIFENMDMVHKDNQG